jgi:hypothetical protein
LRWQPVFKSNQITGKRFARRVVDPAETITSRNVPAPMAILVISAVGASWRAWALQSGPAVELKARAMPMARLSPNIRQLGML